MTSAILALPRDLLYFPIWWYTRGFVRFAKAFGNSLRYKWQELGVGVWIKNLFVPMFGVHDISGRLISFFMRLVNIIGRFLYFLLFAFFFFLWFLIKLLAPAFFGALLFIQIGNFLT
ncbi:MAG TPA: hypothetical protein PL066_00695 [bacterium]|nr:hypothetical protein [bacterium]